MVQASATENAAQPQRRRIERVRRTERRPARSEAWGRILFVAPRHLLILFLVTIVLPVGVSVAGLQLTPYNCVLLVFLFPALIYWLQHAPRVILLDLFMALYILWIAVAIYHNHGSSRLVFIVNQSVTLFGAYFLGRVLVRDPASHRAMFTCLFWILLFLFPFALVEFLFKKSILAMVFGLPGATGGGPAGIRLGLRRTTSVFPHPILFGVFCSIMVSNFFYVFYERTGTRMRRTLLPIMMTFMSLSTGPNLAQMGQLILIAWERLFHFFVTKWYVLVITAVTLISIGQMAYPGGVYTFLVDNLAFNQQTGRGRMEILVYGSQTVALHPIYGIGLVPWNGPWWRPVSVDNFWMVTAMRYGLPALGFIWAGLAWHAVRIISRSGLSEAAASYRKGYVFASAGLVCALAAVHIWASVAVFIMFYIGAGAWLYVGDAALAPVRPRERPRRQPLAAPATATATPGATPAATPAANRYGETGRGVPRRTISRQDLRR